jgi:hypothetical protein
VFCDPENACEFWVILLNADTLSVSELLKLETKKHGTRFHNSVSALLKRLNMLGNISEAHYPQKFILEGDRAREFEGRKMDEKNCIYN